MCGLHSKGAGKENIFSMEITTFLCHVGTNNTNTVRRDLQGKGRYLVKYYGGEIMSEKEQQQVQEVCEIYKDLPDYLKGKIDGYAEAIKQNREAECPGT